MTPAERVEALRLLRAEPALSDAEVARRSGVERRTVARWRAHPPKDAPGGTLRDVPDVPDVPADVPADVPDVAPSRRRSRRSDAPPVPADVPARPELGAFPVTLRVRRRDLEEVAFYLQTARLGGALTVDEWLSGRVADLASFIRRQAPAAVERPAVVASPSRVPHAPRCPRCGGPVLIDQAGRRCINRGCTA